MGIATTYDEKELLRQVAQGDQVAFASLFHHWRDKLYFFILKITGSQEAAEDALQEVFLKLWLNRHTLESVDNFPGWFYRVARNQVINGLRRMALETQIIGKLRQEQATHGLAPDEDLLHKQLQEKLQEAIDKLPPRQKLVYNLTRVQGLSIKEVAVQLQLTPDTVKNHITHALRKIREHVGTDYPITIIYWVLILHFLSPD